MPSKSSSRVQITVNGKPYGAKAGATVLDLLGDLEIPAGRVAIEYNREILKKELWEETVLSAGDALEIVHFVGGG